MRTSFDPTLVVLSILIASVASYVALDLASRVALSRGRRRLAWLAGGALGLGLGVWSMHFIGLLAMRITVGDAQIAVSYGAPLLVLSLIVACGTAWLALAVISGPSPRFVRVFLAGAAIGLSVAGMHYLGMGSMRLPGMVAWRPAGIVASVVIAIAMSIIGLWTAFALRAREHVPGRRRALGALVLGLALAAVHYTGMGAARLLLPTGELLVTGAQLVATDVLAVLVGITTMSVLGLALGLTVADRRIGASISVTAEHDRLRLEAEAARRAAERARDRIAEREDMFRTVADSAPVLIWRSGVDSRCDWFNRPFLEFTGRTLAQELGHGWTEGVHPDDREARLARYAEAFAERRAFEMMYRIRRHDGQYRWLLDRGVPRFAPNGEFHGFIGSCIDVHESRMMEERQHFLEEATRVLNESIAYEETLAAATRLTIPFLADYCSVDLVIGEGEIRRIETAHREPALEAVLREMWARYPYRRSEPFGVPEVVRTGRSVFVPAVPEAEIAAFARDAEHLRMLTQLAPRSYIAVPLVARGTVYGALSLVMSSSGRRYSESDLELARELGRRAGTAIDNARLYASEQAARAVAEGANRAKAEFLATMSHELRTPINATLGYIELITMGLRGTVSDEQRQDLERVRRSQQHLLGVIGSILDFSKIEAGHIEFVLAPVAISDVLGAVEAMMTPLARQRSIALRFHPCADAEALADRDKVQQILVNLIGNAVKFSRPPATVEISCEVEGSSVAITVADHGIGIPDDKLGVIFDPFVQLDASLTRRTEGAGLGLAISRELARGMGGELSVTSTFGVGSTFTLMLPIPAGTGRAGAASESVHAEGGERAGAIG